MPATSNCTQEAVFDYSWHQVAIAFWNRYPNPSSAHVLSEDTIRREVIDGKLYTRRLLSKTNPVPSWGKHFYNNAPVKILEDSVLDPKTQTLITHTWNIGMQKMMKVDEIVSYEPESDVCTRAVRHASISSGVFGFSRAIRAFGVERFKANSTKATNGFNYVLRRMFPDGAVSAIAHLALAETPAAASGGSKQSSPTESAHVASKAAEANVISRPDVMRGSGVVAYDFLKRNATKLAQLLSMRN